MTRVTELTPLLKRLQLGPMAGTLPERIALARRDQLGFLPGDHPFRRGQPPRRPASGRLRAAGFEEAGWKTSTGPPPSPWTAGSWTLSSPWSSSPGMNMSCWWVPPASARPSWPRPWAMPRSGAVTPSACHADDFFRSMAHGWTTPSTAPSAPSSHRTCDPGRPGPPPAHRSAVRRPLRADHRSPSGIQLRDHQQSQRRSASSTIPSWGTAP